MTHMWIVEINNYYNLRTVPKSDSQVTILLTLTCKDDDGDIVFFCRFASKVVKLCQ